MHIDRIDLAITLGSIVGFLVFFAAHVAVFRHIRRYHAVQWFFILIIVVGSLLGVTQTWTTHLLPVATLASVMLFVILACCYFMGVFGLMATSVRIRVLCEIARTGTRGMTMKQLITRYNSEVIVVQRLARLVSNGDLKYFGGKYHARNGFTFFVFPALVLRCMKLLYGSIAAGQ